MSPGHGIATEPLVEAMHALKSQSLGAVLRTALDAVVVMRIDGTIAGWNDVAERTFGWSFAEARGQRMSEMIIPHRYRQAHERGLTHYLATGHGPVLDHHFEIEALHRDGHEMPVELSITRTEQFDEPVFLGFLRDISERHATARRQALMVGELNHRVKNLLGVVAGVAHQTARASTTLADFAPAFNGRLASLAKAHEILTAGAWEQAPLRALADEQLAAYPQISVEGPEVALMPRQLLSVSMILHELLTNAIKYGALASPGGRVRVAWTLADGRVDLAWTESGIGHITEPERRGFGSRMIALSVGHELGGTSHNDWRADGLSFTLAFPIDATETA